MTANAFAEDIQNALDSGMNAYMAKPVNMEVLEKIVREIDSPFPNLLFFQNQNHSLVALQSNCPIPLFKRRPIIQKDLLASSRQ